MSPEQLAALELRRLARDCEVGAADLCTLAGEVAARLTPGEEPSGDGCVFLGWKVHGWYTALEALLERIARTVEGAAPAGPASHRDLLRSMTLPLDDVRPAVLRSPLLPELGELLSFRHFFRHSYAVELDCARVGGHARRVVALQASVAADLGAFAEALREQARLLEPRS